MFRALSPKRFFTIYTRTGDKGTSFLNSETGRLPKHSQIFNFLGDTDELSSSLSIAKEYCREIDDINSTLTDIQHRLQDINSVLCARSDQKYSNIRILLVEKVKELENQIDLLTDQCDPLRSFIIPSGGLAASHLHLSRSICRRTERSLCAYLHEHNKLEMFAEPEMYLNRLSDYLFTAARYCAKIQGHPETPYSSRNPKQ